MSELKTEESFSKIQLLIILGILVAISVIFRIMIFPYDLPITQDGELYFWYANDLSLTKNIPDWGEVYFPNTLWPTFLAVFFSFFSSDNFIEYMELQRAVTTGLSIITVVPIFFLAKFFLNQKYAIIASGLFLFDPRLIENSLGGLSEPLFILLTISSIVLFLNKRISLTYISFVILALATLTRYETIVLIIPFSLLFFWKNKDSKKLIHLFICLGIFFLITLSIDELRSSNTDADSVKIYEHILAVVSFYQIISESDMIVGEKELSDRDKAYDKELDKKISDSLIIAGIDLVKYYGWITIPLFFIFLPIGIYKFFLSRNFEKWTIVICMVFMLLPAIYVFSRDFQEVRYLYIQIPFLCIITGTAIEFFNEKIKKPKIIMVVFLTGMILTGTMFYSEVISANIEQEKEFFEISKKINSTMTVSNEIFPADNYIRSATIEKLEGFPVLRNSFNYFSVHMVPNDEHDSLEDLIHFGKDNDLKHLVIDADGDGINYLYDVFNNEEKYPFLEKIYDSRSDGFTYHVKFFKINFDEFREYYG